MASSPAYRSLVVFTSLLLVRARAGLILQYNNTEHVLYPVLSSNFHGTTPEIPSPLTAPLHIVTLADLHLIESLACDNGDEPNTTNTSFPFNGKILVVPITYRDDYYPHCSISLRESNYASEVDKLAWLCAQGVLGIVIEKQFFEQTNVATVQDWHRPFDRWPQLRHCDTYRVAVDSSLALPFTGRKNMTGVLSWDSDPFLSFFQAPVVLYVYRSFLVISYLAVACLALKHLWQRYHDTNLNFVFVFLLVSAFISMFVLGVGTIFGNFLVWGWQSTAHLFFQLSIYTQFLGTSIAGDYFTAILYTQLASSLRSGVRIQNAGVHRQYPVLFSIGVFICLTDFVYSTLVLIGISLTLLSFLIPAMMWVLEIAVLIFKLRQTLKTVNHLKQSRVALERTSTNNFASSKAQVRLERRIRFWVKVTAASSVTLLVSIVLFGSRLTFRTPWLFFMNMIMLSFGKIGNVLAQVMIAAPPRRRVAAVTARTRVAKQEKEQSASVQQRA